MKLSPTLSVVGGFFLRAILCLIPALAAWYWAREFFAAPPAWIAGKLAIWLFPSWALDFRIEGLHAQLITSLRIPEAGNRISELAPKVNVLVYCYGVPLLTALLVASRARGIWWKLPLGMVIMSIFQGFGVLSNWLVNIAVLSGNYTAPQTGFDAVHVNLIAISYQLGMLLLPTLIPMLTWLQFERRFIVSVIMEGAMSSMAREGR